MSLVFLIHAERRERFRYRKAALGARTTGKGGPAMECLTTAPLAPGGCGVSLRNAIISPPRLIGSGETRTWRMRRAGGSSGPLAGNQETPSWLT